MVAKVYGLTSASSWPHAGWPCKIEAIVKNLLSATKFNFDQEISLATSQPGDYKNLPIHKRFRSVPHEIKSVLLTVCLPCQHWQAQGA